MTAFLYVSLHLPGVIVKYVQTKLKMMSADFSQTLRDEAYYSS
jgi:hypothetical protein